MRVIHIENIEMPRGPCRPNGFMIPVPTWMAFEYRICPKYGSFLISATGETREEAICKFQNFITDEDVELPVDVDAEDDREFANLLDGT